MSQFRSGDQAGSDPNEGVLTTRSLKPVKSTGRIRGPPLALALTEEHQNAAVGGPGRAFVVEALGQDALA